MIFITFESVLVTAWGSRFMQVSGLNLIGPACCDQVSETFRVPV